MKRYLGLGSVGWEQREILSPRIANVFFANLCSCCFVGSLISAPHGCLVTDEHSPGGPADSASSHRPKQQWIPLAASMENICRRITPKLLHTMPTPDVTQFITGATAPKRLVGKQTNPLEAWASGPRSSSAGPEVAAEPPEPCDQL